MRLRAGTFNIHGGRGAAGKVELAAVGEVLQQVDADLWGIQEVHRYLPPPGSFQDQPRRLGQMLGHEVWFTPALGWGPIRYGNALLSRYPLREARAWKLPSGGNGERRVLMEAVLDVGERQVAVLNTHLGLSPEARLEQAERMCRVLERCSEEGRPVIALGDWNGAPESPELRLLVSAGLSHAVPPALLTFPSERPALRLDYIMVSEEFRVRGGEVLDTQVSDHRPLYADLLLEGA